jgi:hypothetical protein
MVLKRKARRGGRGFSIGPRHPYRKPLGAPLASGAMLESEFWRQLAEDFRLLDAQRYLRAECNTARHWKPIGMGESGSSLEKRYIAIATRGAVTIANDGYPTLMDAWFGTLEAFVSHAMEAMPSGKGYMIRHLCEASIDLCSVFETFALEHEYARTEKHVESITFIPQVLAPDVESKDALRTRLKAEREILRDSYLNGFAEKVYVLDVCWAVKQRYREWTRWIGGYLKDKSKPARAFKAILESGKRPEEYRPGPRPKGWK